jgi:hypothetical protein
LKMVRIGCAEMLVNYQSTLRNNPEERWFDLRPGGCLKWREEFCMFYVGVRIVMSFSAKKVFKVFKTKYWGENLCLRKRN